MAPGRCAGVGPVPVPRGISRAAVAFGLRGPSPGTVQGRRTAVTDMHDHAAAVFVASGPHLYHVKVPMESAEVQEGKASMLVPMEVQGAVTTRLDLPTHRHEIQAIDIAATAEGPTLLGSVDSFGKLMVASVTTDVADGSVRAEQEWRGEPPICAGEGGWAGVAFAPGEPSLVATARFFSKSIDLYDGGRPLRTLPTLQPPSALTFLTYPQRALVVVEGALVSIWDMRAGERGGCMERLLPAPGGEPLYAVACAQENSTGLVGVGGAERVLAVYDALRWRVRSRWVGCLKHEITGLSFSSINPSMAYISGLDYEVVCGRWDKEGTRGGEGRLFSFRGDSRWCGVAKASSSDLLAGCCESGNVFVAAMREGEREELQREGAGEGEEDGFAEQ